MHIISFINVHVLRVCFYRAMHFSVKRGSAIACRDLRSFVIRFDFESYVRFEIRFVLMIRFEIFESSALSIVIRKVTIVGG